MSVYSNSMNLGEFKLDKMQSQSADKRIPLDWASVPEPIFLHPLLPQNELVHDHDHPQGQ
jgi:hypothetical protein